MIQVKEEVNLYEYQEDDVNFLMSEMFVHKVGLNFNEMGTGKTYEAIAIANRIMPDKIVFVIPKTLTLRWVEDLERFFDAEIAIYSGAKNKRVPMLETADIVVVGYEMFRIDYKYFNEYIDGNTLLVFDEASYLKGIGFTKMDTGYKTGRGSKVVQRSKHIIRNNDPYVLFLTGTPISKTPLDCFNMFNIYDSTIHYGWFAEMFVRWRKIKVNNRFHDIPAGTLNELKLKQMFQQSATLRKLRECNELPPLETVKRKFKLTGKHKKAYKDFKEELFIETKEGKVIAAKTALDAALRAQQIASDPGLLTGEFADTRIEMLLEDMEALGNQKVIILCLFRKTVERVNQILSDKGYKTAVLYGGLTDSQRIKAEKDFRGEAQVLIGHRKSMGYGLNFQFCQYIINYELTWSGEQYDQAIARVERVGQKNRMVNFVYIAENTIDEKVFDSVQKGLDLGSRITGNPSMIYDLV